MNFNTLKWIYQRLSTPLILILSSWLIFNAYQIKNYNYETVYTYFENYNNLLLFVIFIFLSLFHTSIEIFHSIHDYFSETKNEKTIKYFVITLYLLIFLTVFIFLIKFTLS